MMDMEAGEKVDRRRVYEVWPGNNVRGPPSLPPVVLLNAGLEVQGNQAVAKTLEGTGSYGTVHDSGCTLGGRASDAIWSLSRASSIKHLRANKDECSSRGKLR